MSVIIKSNKVAAANLGNINTINSTPADKYEQYKARVEADGGTITDPAKTLNAFKLLFENAMLGKMTTFVSGYFGVKKDSGGGIDKLYAIDGADMTVQVYNGGTKPILDASNNIDFTANNTGISVSDSMTGAMLETEPVSDWHVNGGFGIVNYLDVDWGNDRSYYASMQPASREYLKSVNFVTTIPSLTYLETSYTDPVNTRKIIRTHTSESVNKPIVITFSESESASLYRDGALITTNDSIDSSAFGSPIIYTLGGLVGNSGSVGFYQGKAKAFMAFTSATENQVFAISNYRL